MALIALLHIRDELVGIEVGKGRGRGGEGEGVEEGEGQRRIGRRSPDNMIG
jgi:hypothetical protein